VAPDQVFTLAQYRDAALAQIAAIMARGRLPLVVGGTGQYLAALLEGWSIPELPPNEALRAELEVRAAQDGGADLYAQLQTLDPVAAVTIHATNIRRVIRALEVCLSTGQPFSQLRQREELTFDPRVIWLTSDTPALYARIDQRVDAMLQAGLLAEVESLLAAGYGWELPAMSGIGYREFMPYFAGEATLAAVVERIKFDTHAFARRQATWFRRFDTHQTTSIDEDAIRRIIQVA
jgi:tRNA dimethylallyltransferase